MSLPLRAPNPGTRVLRTRNVVSRHPQPVESWWATPAVVSTLLAATDHAERERAWGDFLLAYSGLLLRSACRLGSGYDGAMDRYTYILDQLRAGDFRRLRRFRPTASARFTTWLAVVARRLCLDHRRMQYGRGKRIGDVAHLQARMARRRLADLLGECVDVAELADARRADLDAVLAATERRRTLESVLAGLDARSLLLIKLRFANGLSAREIGELMGYPSQFHVFRDLKRVLGRIRQALLDSGVDDSGV